MLCCICCAHTIQFFRTENDDFGRMCTVHHIISGLEIDQTLDYVLLLKKTFEMVIISRFINKSVISFDDYMRHGLCFSCTVFGSLFLVW